MAQASAVLTPFRDLASDDLEAFADARTLERGRTLQKDRQVHELARTADGGIVAWVQGGERYATRVDRLKGRLVSICTCPVGWACKHGVAAALECRDYLERDQPIPLADPQDRRLELLEGDESADGLRAFLERQPRDGLVALLVELAGSHAEVRQALERRLPRRRGDVAELAQAARRRLAEPGGSPPAGEGSPPDATPLCEQLETLLSQGGADEVVALGKELLAAGTAQVERGDDEGEAAAETSACLEVVFRALPRSSLPPAAQLLWAVEMDIADDYALCKAFDEAWRLKRPAAAWSALADALEQRLRAGEDSGYRRERAVGRLIEVLERAGRVPEALAWCEREVEKAGGYPRLAERLATAGRREEAEQWLRVGIEATRETRPEVAEELRALWRRWQEAAGDWPRVAALSAESFFARPALDTFRELQRAAEPSGAGPAVREAALRFLETGKLPTRPSWPLPATGLPAPPSFVPRFPCFETLIELAIEDEQPAEALRWYDRQRQEGAPVWAAGTQRARVADAVTATHPERALEIWKESAETEIARAEPSAYAAAAVSLGKVRQLLVQVDREEEWQAYETALREAHRRKWRFIEVLDALGRSGQPILPKAPQA